LPESLKFAAMKRLNAIQSQNLSFLKFFIFALLLIFLAKFGRGIFEYENNEISGSTPISQQSGTLNIWRG